ncbi:hypothetical protein HG537_0A01280 [Torulaspora globosa]|uniref:Large ribosomal subunit protein uL6m n=1 Tax=Torulaspora globosa TaxID=48254 RepID=A0A7H9HL21_9SACH|nr:hypothetical protein HG537_0A01280 [Torulaspora sp. CBS 2947]
MSFVVKRYFSLSGTLRSHIGSTAIYLTPQTKVSVTPLAAARIIRKGRKSMKLTQLATIEGPRGRVEMEIPDFVAVKLEDNNTKLSVCVTSPDAKIQRSMWGTVRSHLNNHVNGVNEGHLASLRFVGTGYRAQLEHNNTFVNVKVGASVTQGLTIPEGITVKSPSPTSLLIEGCNKQQVLLFAANLRKFHPPEPYKGKGIYVNNETIKLKDKKIK